MCSSQVAGVIFHATGLEQQMSCSQNLRGMRHMGVVKMAGAHVCIFVAYHMYSSVKRFPPFLSSLVCFCHTYVFQIF